ncbi:DUF167 family protein [Thiohalomonas denitrificans]|uniref:UPF0235 protein SAMN03097708_02229 n=1 Tax=Thiohalomonas denitrificans TaxID=415747 RepID=A0A1G5QKR6_9GAMM|nr:DUF167 family protein [Thiohalomonas denitrificans]SCZ61921.1 hypothetical protein SAMN03097708_02229 [Thiohalomonas denitrificans]
MPAWFEWKGEELLLSLRIQPRARRDEITGPHGGVLKVRITAPPVDGKANAHLLRYLARTFDVNRAQIEMVSGQTGRDKRVRIRSPGQLPESAAIQREPKDRT